MKTLLIFFSALVCVALADVISFNTDKICGASSKAGGISKSLNSDDIQNVRFRPIKTSINLLKKECTMEFFTFSLSNKKLQVRFDAVNRMINVDNVKLEFYDDDEVNPGKLIREVSKAEPLGSNNTITTTGPHLTIRGSRGLNNRDDTNYNVEFSIRVMNSASTAKWSLCAALIAAVVKFL